MEDTYHPERPFTRLAKRTMSPAHTLITRGPLSIVLLGTALLAIGLLHPGFQSADGFRAEIILPLVAGLGLVTIGATSRSSFASCARWSVLGGAGHAATLLLTKAGPTLRYQHLSPFSELLSSPAHAGLLLILVTQALVVGWAVHRRRAGWPTMVTGWRLVLFLGMWFLSSATIGRPVITYPLELLFAFTLQVIHTATLLLAILSLPADTAERLASWVRRGPEPGREEDHAVSPPFIDRFVLGCALFSTVVAATLAWFIYERHPHVPDEVAYLLQARTFAEGWLALPLPPVPEAFETYLSDFGSRGWTIAVPPGWPAALAIGVAVGAGWLVNPLLAGLNVVLAGLVLSRLYDRGTTRWAVLLLATSPWHLFLGMSYMTHMWTLACALLATLGVLRARETGQARWTWLGGIALGVMGVTRQLDAMILALLLGIWALGLGGRRLRPTAIAGLVLGGAVGASPVLAYNKYLTGNALTFPVMEFIAARFGPGANAYGFGPDRGMGWPLDPRPGHDVLDGLLNTNLNVTAMHADLFGWPIGSLVLVFLVLVTRIRGSDRLMVVACVTVAAAYFLNYFSGGPDFGARYWHLMAVPLAALTARGIEVVGRGLGGPAGEGRAHLGLALLVISGLVLFVPWRSLDKYRDFRGMRPDIRRLADQFSPGPSLILVRGRDMPDYASVVIYNPASVTGPGPVYAWDRSPAVRSRLLDAYPDHRVWVVSGPSETGAGYRVDIGPLSPDQARAVLLQ